MAKADKKSVSKTDKGEKAVKAQSIAKARALAPELTPNIGNTPRTKFRGNPDIFGTLVDDHDKHRTLFAMIVETKAGSSERKRLFRALDKEVAAHAAAEEQALWSTVLRNPETTKDGRHAVAEHKELDGLFADLAARDMGKKEWMTRFKKLRHEYLHHIMEEETEQFVAAEKHLAPADLKYMQTVFERRKKAEKAKATVKKQIKLKEGGLD